MQLFKILLPITAILLPAYLGAQTITLHKKDAVVWSQEQVIAGEIDTVLALQGILYVNEQQIPFTIPEPGNSFSVPIHLQEKENNIVVQVDTVQSDTLRLTLGYDLRPELFGFATVADREVTLHTSVVENPENANLTFSWHQATDNPSPVVFSGTTDSLVTFSLPQDAPAGEYYFSVRAVASDGDTVWARTYISVDSTAIRPFDIKTDHAAWIDHAIIYEITPYNFVWAGKFNDITAKLEEIAQLGVTTIWLQPVYKTHGRGQGYDVTDYFALRSDLGSEADLHNLIQMAKNLGLRVMFDFVPGHTSIEHPYARDASNYGQDSHYYDFYAPIKDGVRYAVHYNKRTRGKMTFTYYFWQDLPMLNYDNPEVQKMMIEAGKYWIEKFDIDGYRVDAVWGANARNPEFAKKWRLALKRIKPEVLLLAEDKATDPTGVVFNERFDAAYDWYPEESWVSHWVWQTFYSESSNPTIFNHSNENQRSDMLRNSLTNRGAGYHPNAKILRFMENNDTFRFLTFHDLERTKMAATLLFSLHGIPLLYQGQEIGFSKHPYQTGEVFFAAHRIRSEDNYGLFPFYQKLIALRKTYPAMYSDNFAEVTVTPNNYVFAYRRWQNEQNIFGIINMGDSDVSAILSMPVDQLNLDSTQKYYLTDLWNGDGISGNTADLASVEISVDKYSTRLFILADSVVVTSLPEPIASSRGPERFALAQNYPNPFNPSTTIEFNLPRAGQVILKIYDMLGREVGTLLNEKRDSGSHRIRFDGENLSSGVYFYRLQFDGKSIVRKMLLVQ